MKVLVTTAEAEEEVEVEASLAVEEAEGGMIVPVALSQLS